MGRGEKQLTSEGFLDFIEDEVHEGVIALERTADCFSILFQRLLACFGVLMLCLGVRFTFSTAVELDDDGLVHVLGQVQDVLLLGPLRLSTASSSTASTTASTSSSSASVAAAAASSVTATAAASVERSIGHCGHCALARAGGQRAEKLLAGLVWRRFRFPSFVSRFSLSVPLASLTTLLFVFFYFYFYSTGVLEQGGRDSVSELVRGWWKRGLFWGGLMLEACVCFLLELHEIQNQSVNR